MGGLPRVLRYSLARLNGRLPKKPEYAEKGLGCGDVIIWCLLTSIKCILEMAEFHQRINTTPSHSREIADITASVKFSQP